MIIFLENERNTGHRVRSYVDNRIELLESLTLSFPTRRSGRSPP